VHGIDEALSKFSLDAVVTATDNPAGPPTCSTGTIHLRHFEAWRPPGIPSSRSRRHGVRLSARRQHSSDGVRREEADALASGYEAVTPGRAHNLPTFPATVPDTTISGTTLKRPRGDYDARPDRKGGDPGRRATETAPTSDQRSCARSLQEPPLLLVDLDRRVNRSAVPMSPALVAMSASSCMALNHDVVRGDGPSTICFTARSPCEGGTSTPAGTGRIRQRLAVDHQGPLRQVVDALQDLVPVLLEERCRSRKWRPEREPMVFL